MKFNVKLCFCVLILLIGLIVYSLQSFKIKEAYSNKIHFIHIPKNAGSTIKKMYPQFGSIGGHHYDALPKKDSVNIAIIRNPYDRFLSIFHHIKERQYRTDGTKSNDLVNFETIDDFILAYYNKTHPHHKKARELLTFKTDDFDHIKNAHAKNDPTYAQGGCLNDFKCMHWAPQSLFIRNPSEVQYLLKFENLEDNLKILQDRGILPTKDLKHSNKGKYKRKITTPIKKIVDDIYKDDFKLWDIAGIE